MTSPRFIPEHSTRRQNFWLCWLLLACLVGLQVHAPSHTLTQVLNPALNQGGEIALLPWDNSADSHADQSAAHGHSPISDCCPAGLLAVSQSVPAPTAYPLAQTTPHKAPLFLADSAPATPYQSRAPPV